MYYQCITEYNSCIAMTKTVLNFNLRVLGMKLTEIQKISGFLFKY